MFPVADVMPSRTRPYVTIGLIVVNTLAFAAELLAGDRLPRVTFTFGLVPVFFSWPDLLSSLFLHTGWVHFLGNMLYLWVFGDTVEDRLGHRRYLAFYLACGVAAGLGHAAFNPYSSTPAIGASGAISAVMGAYFVLYPHSRILTAVVLIVFFDVVEVPSVVFLVVWVLLQPLSEVGSLTGYAEGGMALWPHVVGFVAGALVGLVARRSPTRYPLQDHGRPGGRSSDRGTPGTSPGPRR